jgi:hypothetical protein
MGDLDIDDQSEIIEGVCAVICARPPEFIPEHLKKLINPVLHSLSTIMHNRKRRMFYLPHLLI